MFADISDSTRLYETHGDAVAKMAIDNCLLLLERITDEYKGSVIKTIGDEIMCTFPSVDYAFLASCSMHEIVATHPDLQKKAMTIQIGFHFGDVIEDNNDVFGDTVNVAARIASLANAGKILVTEVVVEQLSTKVKNQLRAHDEVSLKGKSLPVKTWEILWKQSDDLTLMVNKPQRVKSNAPVLVLDYDDNVYQLDTDNLPFVVGRSDQAVIWVNEKSISRTHFIIEYSRGHYTLTDKSTNGTYIQPTGSKALFLKNEQVLLLGQGQISPGEPFGSEHSKVIQYKYAFVTDQ